MQEEASSLSERMLKLAAFAEGPAFTNLPTEDQNLLYAQMDAMTAYLHILGMRLDRAGSPRP